MYFLPLLDVEISDRQNLFVLLRRLNKIVNFDKYVMYISFMYTIHKSIYYFKHCICKRVCTSVHTLYTVLLFDITLYITMCTVLNYKLLIIQYLTSNVNL